MAREFGRALVTLAEPSDSDAFVEAVVTACTDIINDSQTQGETNSLVLSGVVTPSLVSLSICERGTPFDPSLTGVEEDSRPIKRPDWEKVRGAVDEAHWSSRGNAGMELTLLKRRPQTHITEQ